MRRQQNNREHHRRISSSEEARQPLPLFISEEALRLRLEGARQNGINVNGNPDVRQEERKDSMDLS